MSTSRVYIDAGRMSVSKPGYSAKNPPAVDYKYLALDSRLTAGRPLEIGIIPNYVFGNNVSFTTSYPGIPAVDIVGYGTTVAGGQIFSYNYGKSIGMRDSNGSITYQRTSYYLGIFNDHFQIVDDAVYQRAFIFSTVVQLYYIAWPVW